MPVKKAEEQTKKLIASRVGPDRRLTMQRVAILEELQKVKNHPSARDIYAKVSRKLPDISFGTVYRNLKFMRELNLLRELNCGERSSRFDGNPHDHPHIVCRQCKRVDDLPSDPWGMLNSEAESITRYTVQSHRLEFYGVCPQCRKKGGEVKKRVH